MPPKEAAQPGTASSFPQVATADALNVLHDSGLPWVTADDINKPTQQIAHRIFSHWLEAFSGVNQEWIEKRKEEVLMGVDHRELYEESLSWILFYREVSVLLHACQAYDFGAHDILRPQSKRFRRHLSALINFYRFREERSREFDQFSDETDALIQKRNELLGYRDSTIAKIDSVKADREVEAPQAAKLSAENQRLSQTLYELKREQTRLLQEVDELKNHKGELLNTQTQLTMNIHQMNENVRKLQSRIVTSPQELKDSLKTLTSELKERKLHLGDTEHRSKDFQARIDIMKGIEEDLNTCQSLLVSLSSDQHRLEILKRELQTLETDYDGASSAYSQVSQTLSADSRQLENARKRLERMRKTLEDKRLLRKKREEDWSRKWEEVEGQRWKRSEEATRKQREARDIEREIESELRQYDSEIAAMVKYRNDLVKLAESYMYAIAKRLDWNGQGLSVELETEDVGEELSMGAQ